MKVIPQHTLKFLDSWLTLRSHWADLSGFVVAISKNGKTVFERGYGYADVDSKEKMTKDHVFRIASHSKTFAATAILQLQEQGKLNIDDTVVTYVDWLKDHSDTRWQKVTLRQIMSHSAGVIRDGLDSNYWQLLKPFPDDKTLKQEILEADLVLEPNTKMKYSNYAYSLLGIVISKVSGTSFGEYIEENILTPLQMQTTTPDYSESLEYAKPHSRITLDRTHYVYPNPATYAMASATGLSSNANDLIRYFNAHMIGSGALLSDESKREMQRSQWPVEGTYLKTSYGLGFERAEINGKTYLGHGGGFPGYSTLSLFDPDEQLTVVVLTNTNTHVNTIMRGILSVINGMGERDPSEDLTKFEVRFSDIWDSYEIIATEYGLRGIWPNSWDPFSTMDEFEKLSETELKVSKTDGFGGEGEHLIYTFKDDGTIEYLIEGGARRTPDYSGDVPTGWKK